MHEKYWRILQIDLIGKDVEESVRCLIFIHFSGIVWGN